MRMFASILLGNQYIKYR